MKSRLKKYKDFLHATRGILSENPVLAYGMALPLAVVPSVTLKNAVALTIAVAVTTAPLMVFDNLLGRKIPQKYQILRIPICVLLASLILYAATFAVRLISPNIFDALGIYYPLVAVNNVVLVEVVASGERRPVSRVLVSGLRRTVGFALAICGIAAVRELVGTGTLWGVAIPIPQVVPSVLLPFFGFIFLGLLSAGSRQTDRMLKALILRRKSREKAEASA